MEFTMYYLRFPAGVHFGGGKLEASENTFSADSFFSALCHEALAQGGPGEIEALTAAVRAGALRLSDLFPFVGPELYLPKPLYPVRKEQEGDSIVKKSFKKLKYIPLSQWDAYLQGDLDPTEALAALQRLGKASVRTMIASRSPEKLESGDALPYPVGVYRFYPESGLYLIAGFAEESLRQKFRALLRGLSFSGIGGKRSAGLGRFTAEETPAPAALANRLRGEKTPCMALSVCMAKPDELEAAVEGAQYALRKRSGFIASASYAPEPRRKRDFYVFGAGSCFAKRFAGDVFDVGGGGAHPVYRYAAPLWMEM